MRCQEEIRPFYTAATIISQALQEHTSWASWALNIGIWPIMNIIKRYKVDSLCTSTIKIWQKICLNFVIPARWCPWYYYSDLEIVKQSNHPVCILYLCIWNIFLYLSKLFTILNYIEDNNLKDPEAPIDQLALHCHLYHFHIIVFEDI